LNLLPLHVLQRWMRFAALLVIERGKYRRALPGHTLQAVCNRLAQGQLRPQAWRVLFSTVPHAPAGNSLSPLTGLAIVLVKFCASQ
jgi:hypothetical protein